MVPDDKSHNDQSTTDAIIDQAAGLLDAIESQTRDTLLLTRQALRMMLTGQQPDPANPDSFASTVNFDHSTLQINVFDLEQIAPRWAEVVPDNPHLKAAMAHLLAERHPFAKGDAPAIGQALSLDSPEIAQAHRALHGQPLDTIYARRSPPDTRAFWLRVPGMDRQLMEDMVSVLELVTLPWTETLFRQGDPSDAMYAVVSGRLRAVASNAEGQETVIGEFGRGSVIGEEAAFFSDTRRPATVFAVRDSELARLDRAGMERLFINYPQFGLLLSREFAGRVRETMSGTRPHTDLVNIAIVPAHDGVPTAAFIDRLSEALKAHGGLLHVNSQRLDEQFGEGAAQRQTTSDEMVYWFAASEMAHRFVVLETDPALTPWTQRCLSMADRILVVADAGHSPQMGEVEARLYGPNVERISVGVELILLQPDRDRLPTGTNRWLEPRHLRRHHHLHMDTPADFAKLARFMAGKAVGLVLSGGGARGMAHVGVVRALDEAGIPIDAVGATSFGAIAGALVGMEYDWRAMYDVAHGFSQRTGRYFRLALPLISLMEGRRLNRLFQGYYEDIRVEDIRVEDLWRSYFCLASNLTQSRLETLDRGLLWRAVRASMSIPSVFPPMLQDGDLMVDGGVMNNLPSDIMQDHLEGGVVIASNTSSEGTATYDYDDDHVSSWRLLWARLNPALKAERAPSMVDVVTQTMGLASKWRRPRQLTSTDLLVDIPVEQYGLFDYHALDELVEAGYRATQRALEARDRNLSSTNLDL